MTFKHFLFLIPFLFSLNAISKGRTKNDQTVQQPSRAPASSTENNTSTGSNDGTFHQLTWEECLGLTSEEDCRRNFGGEGSAAFMGPPAPEGDPRFVGPPTPADVQARMDWIRNCENSNPEASHEACVNSYNTQYGGGSTSDSGNAETGGLGKEACEQSGKMWDGEAGCVTKPNASGGDSNKDGDGQNGNVYTCAQANQEVKEACDSEKKSWMTGINDVVRTLGPAVNQINPSTCGGIAAAQSGAQGSLATFAVMCNSALKKCTETCTNLPADSTMLTECKKMGTKSEQAQQQMASAMVTLRGSVASCQNAFGDLNQQAQAYCASNPSACAFNLPGGVQASVAGADQAGGSLPNPGLGSQGSGSAGTGAKGLDLNALGGDDGEGIGKINPSKAGEDPGGAKGGGHVAGGSGGGGGGDAGGGRGGKKEGGILSNILSGFFGSGGSGGGGGGGFLKKFFGGDKSDAYAANNPKKAAGPDLRQFLPGGLQDPNRNRGIAGQFIGRDGMSGPHSDIWKNINNRYQYKRASLLP